MVAAIELCIIVAGITTSESTWPKRAAALLLPNGKNPDCIRLTPTTVVATILMVLGATIRYLCFRELGRHFTFHVTVLENHKLVTTGPYSIVRHPAYVGTLFMVLGQVIWYTAPGSWLREGMIYQIKSAWLILTPVIFCLYLGVGNTFGRVRVEDAMLRKEFGKGWDKWAQAVPYRLFPGIY
jgi:protein-S-isoprenylcysteine O-methyltransferase Ste14